MKNKNIISAIVGSAFFAVPYLGLSIGFLPALAIGVGAFGASELIFSKDKKDEVIENNYTKKTSEYIIAEARGKNQIIKEMSKEIEDEELVKDINSVSNTINKILNTVQKDTSKIDKISNFFDYYLPVTIKILKNYDNIENQQLSTSDANKFMNNTKEMIMKIDGAFKDILAKLYQKDIIDTDADMKVFETMLMSDGFGVKDDFNIKKEGSLKNEG